MLNETLTKWTINNLTADYAVFLDFKTLFYPQITQIFGICFR
jgi:hypothetical protein